MELEFEDSFTEFDDSEERFDDLTEVETLLYSYVYHDATQEYMQPSPSFVTDCELEGTPLSALKNNSQNAILSSFKDVQHKSDSICLVTPVVQSKAKKHDKSDSKELVVIDLSDDDLSIIEEKRQRFKKSKALKEASPFKKASVKRWSESDTDSSDLISLSSDEVNDTQLTVAMNYKPTLFNGAQQVAFSAQNCSLDSTPIDLATMSMEQIMQRLPDNGWDIAPEDKISHDGLSRYYLKRKSVECKICRGDHRPHQCPKKWDVKLCHLCANGYHYTKQCPQRPCVVCLSVGSHTSHVCSKRKDVLWNTVCCYCQGRAHDEKNCPSVWRLYANYASCKRKPKHRAFCYNCGHSGHYGHQCKKPYSPSKLVPFNPFLCVEADAGFKMEKQNQKTKKQKAEHNNIDNTRAKQKKRKGPELQQQMRLRNVFMDTNGTKLNKLPRLALKAKTVNAIKPASKRKLLEKVFEFANVRGKTVRSSVANWSIQDLRRLTLQLAACKSKK